MLTWNDFEGVGYVPPHVVVPVIDGAYLLPELRRQAIARAQPVIYRKRVLARLFALLSQVFS